MSFNNKRQSKSSFEKRWSLNKSRVSSRPISRTKIVSFREKSNNKVTFKTPSKSSLNQTQLQHSYEMIRTPFITSELPLRAYSSLHEISQTEIQQHKNISIDKLQAQIDRLLKQKLKILINFNKDKLVSKAKNIPINSSAIKYLVQLNVQLQTLIKQLKSSLSIKSDSKNIQKWKQFDQKIKILEKMIAQNYSEVEIMKQYYGAVGYSSTSYRKFCKQRDQSKVNNIKNKHLKLNKEKISNIMSPTSRLPFISETKTQYKTPNKDYYKLKTYNGSLRRGMDQNYETIIETSAYKRSYRQYPYHSMPQVRQRYSSLPMNPFVRSSESSYSKHYPLPQKSRIQNPHYKKLDCYKDKYKSVDVRYLNTTNDSILLNENAEYIKMNQSINKTMTQPQILLTPSVPRLVYPYCRVQAGDQKMYMAKPKNNRLQFLKGSYRFLTPIQ